MKLIKEGKVREIYDVGANLIIVATDRISCYDVILKNTVPGKGKVLTGMSRFWFEYTSDIISNHMISVDMNDMPEYFHSEQFESRSMLCKKLNMIPVECVVRGYITGSSWESYQSDGTVCGIVLPKGLQEAEQLSEPIFTPAIKAEVGGHDENVTFEQCVSYLEEIYPGKGLKYAEAIRWYSINIYKKCAAYALSRGIIIADTKFEFGLDKQGEIILGDEILTPDSSRFWPVSSYKPGYSQPSFDKQLARDWLISHPNHMWELPDEIVNKTIEKYKEVYSMLME